MLGQSIIPSFPIPYYGGVWYGQNVVKRELIKRGNGKGKDCIHLVVWFDTVRETCVYIFLLFGLILSEKTEFKP